MQFYRNAFDKNLFFTDYFESFINVCDIIFICVIALFKYIIVV